jgi:DNA-directed RNA polymerase specialized sigma24 family protein
MPVASADDFVQEFAMKKILGADIVRHVTEGKGKFRNFLLVCLNNAIRDHYRVRKNQEPIQEDSGFEAALPSQDYDDQFDGIWARKVFLATLERMKQVCEAEGKSVQWLVFRERVVVPLASTRPALSYEELTERAGLPNAKSVQNTLVNAKRRFQKCLKDIVVDYVGNEADVESEIEELCRVLSRGDVLDSDALAPLLMGTDVDASVSDARIGEASIFDTILSDCGSDTYSWTESDLGVVWRQMLNRDINDVCELDIEQGNILIRHVIEGVECTPETYNAIRLASRRLSKETAIPVYLALYGLAIAAARMFGQASITSLAAGDLKSLFARVNDHAFLDEASRSLLHRATNCD